MDKTPYYSYKLNTLPKGCRLCVEGKKSVFFVTGICTESCYYCPLSEQKKDCDVTYINEWPTSREEDIIKEITLCRSEGIGITGGDPLARLDRTIHFITVLKKRFGKKFHIHLYTILTQVTEHRLKRLYDAGLDEIRFHPNLEHPDPESWKKIAIAKKLPWIVGVEVPALPKQEKLLKKLIDYVHSIEIDFVNLNQLEYSDTNAQNLESKKLFTFDSISYAIEGSEKTALSLLSYVEKKHPEMNVHYCTAKLKDKVQMTKRLRRRAHSIRLTTDQVKEDGCLLRGVIYLKDLSPGVGYRRKLALLTLDQKKEIFHKLKNAKHLIESECKANEITIDENRLRLLTSPSEAKKISKKIKDLEFICAIVEEYPTHDQFEVDIEFL